MNLYEPRILHAVRLINLYDFHLMLQTALSFHSTVHSNRPVNGKTDGTSTYFRMFRTSRLKNNLQAPLTILMYRVMNLFDYLNVF